MAAFAMTALVPGEGQRARLLIADGPGACLGCSRKTQSDFLEKEIPLAALEGCQRNRFYVD